MKRSFPRLAAVGLLTLVVLPLASGQTPATTGAPLPSSELSEALKLPGSLQSRFRFDHLTSTDGLSNDSVFGIVQDHRGFMWFGTQGGLNRYDGYRIIQYRHDPKNSNSLGEDFIQTMFEDSRGGIWTGKSVLSRLDPDTETFTRYSLPNGISAIGEGPDGSVWAAADSSTHYLYRLDLATGTFRTYEIGAGALQWQEIVRAIHCDEAGTLWLGTTLGLIRFDPATGNSIRYDRDSPASKRYGDAAPSGNNGERKVWDLATGLFTRGWSRSPNVPGILSLRTDPGGTAWIGTGNDGLDIFDSRNGTLNVLRNNPADGYSLSGDEVWSIAEDREGNLWVGVKGGGVNRLSARGTLFGAWRHNSGDPDSLGDDNVRTISGDGTGSVWLGTYSKGLDRFEPRSGKFTHYRHDPRNPRTLAFDQVYSTYVDRAGTLWVGTSKGIDRFDRNNGTFEQFSRDDPHTPSPCERGASLLLLRGSHWPVLVRRIKVHTRQAYGRSYSHVRRRPDRHARRSQREPMVVFGCWLDRDEPRREISQGLPLILVRRGEAGGPSGKFLPRGFCWTVLAGH